MSDQKHNLSKSELAAIDFMIAYMQDNKKTELQGFWDSIVNVVNDAAKSVTNVVSTVAQGVTDVANTAAQAVTNTVNAAGVKGEKDSFFQATGPSFGIGVFGDQLNSIAKSLQDGDAPQTIKLDDLIKLRNQANK